MAILEIKNISKVFEDNLVVDNISLNINQKEFFTLLGPSGCGKTTLLRMIAGFTKPDSGIILLDGIDITNLPPEKRPLHTIFQSYALFPHMTVFDNIAFPLKMAKWNKSKLIEQVEELLEDVQLTKFAHRYPHELSGGQKQRVAIARSLTGVTFIYVTHDQSEALALSSRIAVMNLGKVEQLDTPQDVYSKPETYFVADFLGKCNLLSAEVLAINHNIITLKVADILEFDLIIDEVENIIVGQKGWYSIRPEKVKAKRQDPDDEDLFSVKATVKGYYYYGDGTLYEFLLANGTKIQSMLSNNKATQASFFNDNSDVIIAFEPESGNFLVR